MNGQLNTEDECVPIHREPDCVKPDNGCIYQEPHRHGFECDGSCVECHKHCHPECPAYFEERKLMETTTNTPAVEGVIVPVYMPVEGGGVANLVIGEGTLKDGELTVKFKDNFPGIAVQRLLARGVVLGLSYVILEREDEEREDG